MSSYSEAGKGSAPRQKQDQDAYTSGWDRIFGKAKSNGQAEETRENPTEGTSDQSPAEDSKGT